MEARFDPKLIRELIIRKKKLEREIEEIKKYIEEAIKDVPPGDYGDIKVISTSRLMLDTSKLRRENPDIYFKYLTEIQYKYANLKKEVKDEEKTKSKKKHN